MIDFDIGDRKTKKPPIGLLNIVLITIIIAVIGVVCIFFNGIGAVVFGAVGLLLGGYCMGLIHKHATASQKNLMVFAAVALLLSVIAFMLGFMDLAESL